MMTGMPRAALALLIMIVALRVGTSEAVAGSPQPIGVIAGHEVSRPVLGIRYGTPQRWSGSVSLLLGKLDHWDRMPIARGMVFSVDCGQGGGKGSIGLTALTPRRMLTGFYPHGVIFGAVLRGSVLRAWGDPLIAHENVTYVGPELEVGTFFTNLSLGYMVRLSGSESSRRDFFAWSIGVGF
jgi:hypothetical protein